MPRPRSRALAMDSSTTIESSTTRPVASARPPSDITLRLSSNWPMKKNVAMIDTGSDRPITNVLQPSRRNRKMIRMASAPPITASNFTSLMAWRMNCDWSSMVVSSTSAGIWSLISFELRCDRVGGGDGVRVAFLVDGQLDGFLAAQADDRLAFLVALRTSAMSFRRIGMPPATAPPCRNCALCTDGRRAIAAALPVAAATRAISSCRARPRRHRRSAW